MENIPRRTRISTVANISAFCCDPRGEEEMRRSFSLFVSHAIWRAHTKFLRKRVFFGGNSRAHERWAKVQAGVDETAR